MSQITIDDLIQEVSKHHKTILDKDDPIVMLLTVQRLLTKSLGDQQVALIEAIGAKMAESTASWQSVVNKRADTVVESAIAAATRAIYQAGSDAASEAARQSRKHFDDRMGELVAKIAQHQRMANQFAWLIAGSTLVIAVAAIVLLCKI